MSYHSGEIIEDENANLTFYNLIADALTAHSAWSFIEERVSGASTLSFWRCAGPSNSWGQPWVIRMQRNNDTNGAVYIAAMEDYDPLATNLEIINPCAARQNADQTDWTAPNRPWNNNLTSASSGGTSTSTVQNIFASVNTNVFKYWFVISPDMVMVATDVATTTQGAVGIYESLFDPVPSENYFPLFCWPNLLTSVRYILLSRHVNATTAGSYGFCYDPNPWTTTTSSYTTIPGNRSTFQDNKYLFTRIGFVANDTLNTHWHFGNGGPAGLVPTSLFYAWSAANRGDTVTLNGVTYTYINNHIWVEQDASV